MIEVLGSWSGTILEGDHISFDTLPPYATIGLQQGGGAWATNHPRPRGITHVVQIVRHPGTDAPLVSEAQGWAEPYGLRLLPLADWLRLTQPYLKTGNALGGRSLRDAGRKQEADGVGLLRVACCGSSPGPTSTPSDARVP